MSGRSVEGKPQGNLPPADADGDAGAGLPSRTVPVPHGRRAHAQQPRPDPHHVLRRPLGRPPRHDTGALVLDVRDRMWDPADAAITAPLVVLTGLDPEVRDYVLSAPDARQTVERTGRQLLALHRAGTDEAVHLYVACWYGRHRAPAVARAVADWLAERGTAADVEHRDIARPLIHREPAKQLEACAFCRMAAGTDPAPLVRDWPDAFAIVPRRPVTPGHLLVIPRRHVRDATTDPAVTAAVMQRAAEPRRRTRRGPEHHHRSRPRGDSDRLPRPCPPDPPTPQRRPATALDPTASVSPAPDALPNTDPAAFGSATAALE
ncbi:RapZ C-terminal domain-containing protein [Streptomyces lydicamycinicus]|uniref:HIT family protein n=1 Tax=Streptomyces lydicamycinicus TaxID=1546107 RepID=UPI003D807E89